MGSVEIPLVFTAFDTSMRKLEDLSDRRRRRRRNLAGSRRKPKIGREVQRFDMELKKSTPSFFLRRVAGNFE